MQEAIVNAYIQGMFLQLRLSDIAHFLWQFVQLSLQTVSLVAVSPLFWLTLWVTFQYYEKHEWDKASARKLALASSIEGLMAGIVVVWLIAGLGLVIEKGAALLCMGPVSMLLSLIRPRFLCMAYGAGLTIAISLALGYHTEAAGIMSLVAILHLAEGLLVLCRGGRHTVALYRQNKRQLLPASGIYRFWPVPICLLIVAQSPLVHQVQMPSWWPLVSDLPASTAFGLLPIAVTLGYSDLSGASTQVNKRRWHNGLRIVCYALVLLSLSLLSSAFPEFLYVSLGFMVFGHEHIVKGRNIKRMKAIRVIILCMFAGFIWYGLAAQKAVTASASPVNLQEAEWVVTPGNGSKEVSVYPQFTITGSKDIQTASGAIYPLNQKRRLPIGGTFVISEEGARFSPYQILEPGKRYELRAEINEEETVTATFTVGNIPLPDEWIEVSLGTQQWVYIHQNGEITKVFPCSGGRPESPSLLGMYQLQERGSSFFSQRFNEGARYWIRIQDQYLFHSVPRDEKQQIIEKEYLKIGVAASHGCVRLYDEDALWIYENMRQGTTVILHPAAPDYLAPEWPDEK